MNEPLARLRAAADERTLRRAEYRDALRNARSGGYTAAEIGKAVGITRQSVLKMTADVEDVPRNWRSKRVYFIQPIGGGPIKIGCAANVERRLAHLQAFSPAPLRILGSLPGGVALERELHVRFSEHRLHGEWFTSAITESMDALLAEDELR